MEVRKDPHEQGLDAPILTEFTLNPEPDETAPFGYIVDLAKYPNALRLLFECDPAPAYDLPYLYSGYREDAYNGPLLIEPIHGESSDWLQDWLQQGKALAVFGKDLTLQSVRQHLVSLDTVQTPYGQSLFRYAAPATFASVGPSLSHLQRLRILGPLSAIRGSYMDRNWCISSQHTKGPDFPGDDQSPLELTQENLAAIADYRLELLSKAMAEGNNLEHGLIINWFRQLESLGAPNEQGLVEGSELLIRSGLTRPLTDMEVAHIRQTGSIWSDKLEAIARLESQEGT